MQTVAARLACVVWLLATPVGCGGPGGQASGTRVQAAGAEAETSPPPLQEPPAEAPLRVMSFNLRFDHPPDGEHRWPRRADQVAELIRFHHPDLLGVQEALPLQVTDLEEQLDGYEWFGAGREGDSGETSAVIYRKKRFELLDGNTFWLSETPDEPSRGWDAKHNRVVTWGRLRDRKTDHTIYFFNNPLRPRRKRGSQQKRRAPRQPRPFAARKRAGDRHG